MVNLQPILNAPFAVQIHLATVIPAFFLGTWLIFRSSKGGLPHRAVGFTYLLLMSITATAAIFIREINPGHFSWLHVFVALTYVGVIEALWSIRRRNLAQHKRSMISLYYAGLVTAGALTFIPGRVMYRMFFH